MSPKDDVDACTVHCVILRNSPSCSTVSSWPGISACSIGTDSISPPLSQPLLLSDGFQLKANTQSIHWVMFNAASESQS